MSDRIADASRCATPTVPFLILSAWTSVKESNHHCFPISTPVSNDESGISTALRKANENKRHGWRVRTVRVEAWLWHTRAGGRLQKP